MGFRGHKNSTRCVQWYVILQIRPIIRKGNVWFWKNAPESGQSEKCLLAACHENLFVLWPGPTMTEVRSLTHLNPKRRNMRRRAGGPARSCDSSGGVPRRHAKVFNCALMHANTLFNSFQASILTFSLFLNLTPEAIFGQRIVLIEIKVLDKDRMFV